MAPQMQATPGYINPVTQAYVSPQTAFASASAGFASPGQTFVPQPSAGYPAPSPTQPLGLQPEHTGQLTAQERSQQEAFNREMQAFNQVILFSK